MSPPRIASGAVELIVDADMSSMTSAGGEGVGACFVCSGFMAG